jgi:hypothetical protein
MLKISKYNFLFITLLLNSLASVSIFSIPITWLGMLFQLTLSMYLVNWKVSKSVPIIYFFIYLFIALFSWIIFAIFNFSEINMPLFATTNYLSFIILRFSTILVFFISIIFIFNCLETYTLNRVINLILNISFFVALYAIYTYFAQLFSLPELIPRSRIGTSGNEQSVSFTTAGINLQRALGTFREPSHLAEWLMLPLTLSFIINMNVKFQIYKKISIVLAIILSVSLSAILSITIGFFLALFLFFVVTKFKIFTKRMLINIFLFIFFLFIVILYISSLKDNIISDVLFTRLDSLLSDGLFESNRGSIYVNLKDMDLSFLGYGPGNANLILTKVDGSPALVSFLSLYLNNLYSIGIFGFIFFLIIIFFPIFSLRKISLNNSRKYLFPLLWGYCSFLISFFVHSEEFNLMFSFSYTLLLFISKEFKFNSNDNYYYKYSQL